MSKFQLLIKQALNKWGFEGRYFYDYTPSFFSKLEYDFYFPTEKIAIEINGS